MNHRRQVGSKTETQRNDGPPLDSKAHGASKSIITVFEFRRYAASRSNPRDLDLMPPRAAPRSAARSGRGTLRIASGRVVIVILIEPIRTPFVDVLRDVLKPKFVWRPLPNLLRS